jgi:ParB-like chromosome segregation protein Spo0J
MEEQYFPHYIHTDKVVVKENRQRREFDPAKLMELGTSFESPGVGILQPIVLRKEGDKDVLVAGERRLRVVKDAHELGVVIFHAGMPIPHNMIPYLSIGELSELDAEEAELEENIRRVDLTWQEKAAATTRLMALRVKQAEAKDEVPPTRAQLAEEVYGKSEGVYQENIRQDIILAKRLDDPDVAGAKTAREAMKIVKRKEETKRNTLLAQTIGKTFNSSAHQLYNKDSQEWAKGCASGSFDCILTDAPYGMNADEFGDGGGVAAGEHGYADSPDVLSAILMWFPKESFRLAKEQAHLYFFCDIDWFPKLKPLFAEAGWKVFRTPLIWHKPQGARAPWPEEGPQRKYETILFAVKGGKKTKKMGGDVITCPADDNLGHAAQKPVDLYKELLARSIGPGDSVADFFCGSGPIFPAAHALMAKATGVEKAEAAFGIAATRIKELV